MRATVEQGFIKLLELVVRPGGVAIARLHEVGQVCLRTGVSACRSYIEET